MAEKEPKVLWTLDCWPSDKSFSSAAWPTIADFESAIALARRKGFTDQAWISGTRINEYIEVTR